MWGFYKNLIGIREEKKLHVLQASRASNLYLYYCAVTFLSVNPLIDI